MKRVFILANGGENIGLGHIMRTLVLAKELVKRFEVTYVCKEQEEFIKGVEKIESENFKCIYEEKFLKILDKKDILIIDRYDIDEKTLKELKDKGGFIVFFDDNNRLENYPSNVVFNQNLYAETLNYPKKDNLKFLLGGKYTLLREEFLKYKGIEIKKDVRDILLTLGGSDNKNLTEKIIEEIKECRFNIHVILGSAFKYGKRLKEKYKMQKNIIFYENANMPKIMEKVDLCISACGSTIYELCYLGIPTIGLVIAENQKDLGEYAKRVSLCEIANIDNIKGVLDRLDYNRRKILNKNMIQKIDGKGKERVVEEILNIYSKEI